MASTSTATSGPRPPIDAAPPPPISDTTPSLRVPNSLQMDPSTHTPLLEAIWAGDLTMVRALLEDQAHGCNFRVYPEDATHVLQPVVTPKPIHKTRKPPARLRRTADGSDDDNDDDDDDLDTAGDAVPITVDIVHERDLRYSRPPLTLAAQWAGPVGLQMLQLLIDARAHVNAMDSLGATALHVAAECGIAESVELLLRANAAIDAPNKKGLSPLYLATHNNHIQVVNCLLDARANPDLETPQSRASSASFLMQTGDLKTYEAIYSLAGSSAATPGPPAAGDGAGSATPLVDPTSSARSRTRAEKFNQRQSGESNSQIGCFPLYAAAQHGHAEILKLLLEKGRARPNATYEGATPLMISSSEGHLEAVRLLVAHGALVDQVAKTGEGGTALHFAARSGHAEIVDLLLANNADACKQNRNGFTPLYIASYCGHDGVVSMLLHHGADPNTPSAQGVAPLYAAAQEGHRNVVAVLLAAGADDRVRFQGNTPEDIAELRYHHKVVSLFTGAVQEEGWDPDTSTENCTACRKEFSIMRRKHHCRSCKHIFCSKCSTQQCIVPALSWLGPLRVCDGCYSELRKKWLAVRDSSR